MTRLALIPPLTHLELGSTNMHLLLAHMCADPKYVKFYRERSVRGDFLILDNSAYEHVNAHSNLANLFSLGYFLQADEVVAPDTIMNEQATYGHMLDSVAFMSTVAGQYAWRHGGYPRIMVVPQVDPNLQGIDGYERHARLLMDLWHAATPYLSGRITLGVSKNMDKLEGGWLLLFRHVISELVKDYPIQVHLLGLPHRSVQTRRVLRENPYIRSIDTATPFIQAMYGQTMQVPDSELIGRPANYNEYLYSNDQLKLVKTNVEWMCEYFIRPATEAAPRAATEHEKAEFESRARTHG